jgi:hypothetical protein
MRLHAQTALIENGFVHIPQTVGWFDAYLHEMTVFPNGKHEFFSFCSACQPMDPRAGSGGAGCGLRGCAGRLGRF